MQRYREECRDVRRVSWLEDLRTEVLEVAAHVVVGRIARAALDLTDQLAGTNVTISRLAHGVPIGGELDYLDEGTLAAAVKARKTM